MLYKLAWVKNLSTHLRNLIVFSMQEGAIYDPGEGLSPRLGFRERVSGSVFASRLHFFASIILSAGSAVRIAITAMTTSSSMRVNAKPWAALLAGTEQVCLRGFMANRLETAGAKQHSTRQGLSPFLSPENPARDGDRVNRVQPEMPDDGKWFW